ncbi:YcxB family protein [Streptomyces griseoluteus]|uniref:YcxB family protein n=1 Tax=Streptomyces griseoluteus TaxID=29306 RepID=UPI003317E825
MRTVHVRHLSQAEVPTGGTALSPRVRRSRNRAVLKGAVGAAVAVGLVMLQERYTGPTPLVYFAGCLSAGLAGRHVRTALLTTPWGRRWSARREGYVRPGPEVTVDDGGITVGTGGRPHLEPWDAFTGYVETERLFVLLRTSGRPAVVLPKRTFPDAVLAAECRRLLAEHLPPR